MVQELVHNAVENIYQELLCQWLEMEQWAAFGPVGSAGTVGGVGDTQMGEADTLGNVGAMFSALSVCEAGTVGSTDGMYYCKNKC